MNRPRGILLFAILSVAASSLFLLGCGDDDGTKPEEPTGYPAATTIDQLLTNFRDSYVERDSEELGRLLHEEFAFVFDPRDVGPDTWPEASWGRVEELRATGNLFTGEPNRDGLVVERIRLEWTLGEPEISPDSAAWMRVTVAPVDLEVRTVNPTNGDRIWLILPGGYAADFHLLQTEETDPASGQAIWKIVKWVDRPPGGKGGLGPGTETSSWGRIKALFY